MLFVQMTVVILDILVSSAVIFQRCDLRTLTISPPPPPNKQTQTKNHNKTQAPKTKCTVNTLRAGLTSNNFGYFSPKNKTFIF